MGKRKRTPDLSEPSPSPPPEVMTFSSGLDLLTKETSSHAVDSNSLRTVSTVADITPVVLQDAQPSFAHQPAASLSRSIFLKRSRQYFGHQYSRRKSANHAHALSTSHGKNTPLRDERLFLKFASKSDHEGPEDSRQKAICRPERIRSSSSFITGAMPDVASMACGVCQKLLRRKHYVLGDTPSPTDVSVVAVLVCGHVYHGDCLEQGTRCEDTCDPPCPMCMGSRGKD